MKRNQVYGKVLAVFLLLLLFCTFFSKSIYNFNLPRASVVFPMQGELKHDVAGTVEIAYKNTWGEYAENDGRIREIRVSAGDLVNAGDVLLVLKQNGEEGNAEVRASRSGRVLSVETEEGMYVSAVQNEPLLRMAEMSGQWRAELGVEEETAAGIETGSQVSLDIPGTAEEIWGTVVSVGPVEPGEITGYKAVVDFEYGEEMIAGKRAQAVIRRQGQTYNGIVPGYALHKDDKGYYVWMVRKEDNILGTHYVVHRLSVDLMDTDETVAALMGVSAEQPIIASCTEELKDGDRVDWRGSDK